MKTLNLISIGLVTASIAIVAGCALTDNQPPSKIERYLYDIKTNFTERVVTKTNFVDEVRPMIVRVTNEVNQIITTTNYVTVPVPVPITETQQVAHYALGDVKPSTSAGIQAGGSVANMAYPGLGGVISGLAIGLLGAWRKVRNSRQETNDATDTGGVLVNNVQAIREFVRTLPNGSQYDAAIKQFLMDNHQSEDVAVDVADLIATQLDSKTARDGVADIRAILQSIRPQPTAPTAPAAPAA